MEFTTKELARILKGTVEGNPNEKVFSFAKIEHGKPGKLCFYANPKYEHYVYETKASAIIVNKDFVPKEPVPATLIRVDDAYSSVAFLLKYVHRAVLAAFDRDVEDYALTVGSAGISGAEADALLKEMDEQK